MVPIAGPPSLSQISRSSHPARIVPCQGVPAGNGRSCGWRMWFPDITYQANSLFFHVNVR
jgi:hypothetical protein